MKTKKLRIKLILLATFIIVLSFQGLGQGQLWGVTKAGGVYGDGVVFKTQVDGTGHGVYVNFKTDFDGEYPLGKMCLASDGNLYGVTNKGGSENVGVIFSYNSAANQYEKIFDFTVNGDTGYNPVGGIVQHPNGKLYGLTSWGVGPSDPGLIYEFDPASSVYLKKFTFGSVNGAFPNTALLVAANGKLYGTTPTGGLNDQGILFEFDPVSSIFTKKFDFASYNLQPPMTDLINGNNGKIYGVCNSYPNGGVIFEYDNVTNTVAIKYTSNGSNTVGISGIVAATNNKIYGIGGPGIYEVDISTGTYTVKASFAGSGIGSCNGLTMGTNGRLYGASTSGGAYGYGTVFEFDLSGNSLTKIFEFNNMLTGTSPRCILTEGGDNKIYGTTTNEIFAGGTGTLFQVDPLSRQFISRKLLIQASSGKNPNLAIVKSNNGGFYGVTTSGGKNNTGKVFSFNPSLNPNGGGFYEGFDFSRWVMNPVSIPPNIGSFPEGGITASNNKFYGVTRKNGANNFGGIYELVPGPDLSSASISLKHSFAFDHSFDDSECGLTLANNGKLYGMTSKGGANGLGTIYEYNISVTTIYSFDGTTGSTPYGSFVLASNGKLYAMTKDGGANGYGTVIEFDPSINTVTKKFDFTGSTSGSNPRGNLIQASNGHFYGMATNGGTNNLGTIFKIDGSTFAVTKLVDFNSTNGAHPYGSLMESPNGKLYGTTFEGGSSNLGVLFEYDITTNTLTKKLDYNGLNGANPIGSLIYDGQSVKNAQTITFDAIPDKYFGGLPFALTATASSGLPVTFISSNTSVASVSGNIVTIVGLGTATITASQSGDATTHPAQAKQTLVVQAKQQFTPIGAGHIFSLFNDFQDCGGNVRVWGKNAQGQLGIGSTLNQFTSVVTQGQSDIVGVAGGYFHSLFMKKDGTVWAAGENSNGRLGDGTTISRTSLVQASGLSGIVAISAGVEHSLFLKYDGTVWGAGSNSFGQLGLSGIITTPTQIPGLSGITSIAAGSYHSLFLGSDGTVWVCGRNNAGQLGNGVQATVTTPIQIGTITDVIAIAAGSGHSIFLKSDGTAWSTGRNSSGQLGIGTLVGTMIPTLVSSLTSVKAVSAGENHSLFLLADGTVKASGLNNIDGRLGDGTFVNRSTPVSVVGLSGVTSIDAGWVHSLFLRDDGLVYGSGQYHGKTPISVVNINPCNGNQQFRARLDSFVLETSLLDYSQPEELFLVHPIPANETLYIEDVTGGLQEFGVSILDLTGKTVRIEQLNDKDMSISIDTSNLENGVFILTVQTPSQIIRKKIIIRH